MQLVGFNKHEGEEGKGEGGEDDNEEFASIPKSLTQNYVLIDESEKVSFLISYLKQLNQNKVVLFVSTIDEVEFLSMVFQKMTFRDK